MGCGCQGASNDGDSWVNVKADGTPSKAMTKADALASQKVSGGYLRRA